MTSPSVVAIFGPTASGKSAIAAALARVLPGELVSADSAQVYRELPVLTNQSPAHLVAIRSVAEEISVAEYQVLAHAAIDGILARGRTPIVVGGTGLYLRAAVAGFELPPAPLPDARRRWQAQYDRLGGDTAHALLAERDPEAAAAVHPNDRRRVVRALELAEVGHSLAGDGLWSAETRLPTLVVGLGIDRDVLVDRIEARTRSMFEAGVEAEVAAALELPLSATAEKVMGLTEISTLPREEAIAALALHTRQLAAYQRKWMRRIPGLVTVEADRSPSEVADEILALARGRQRVPGR